MNKILKVSLVILIILVVFGLAFFAVSKLRSHTSDHDTQNADPSNNNNPVNTDKCGDGTCDDVESANPSVCPADCGDSNNNQNAAGSCGDGTCDEIESSNTGVCPQDCTY